MTDYDRVPGHPLAGVPDVVLNVTEVAITTYARNQPQQGIDDCDAPFLAEQIVESLHRKGYVTWPGRVPSREAIVLALMSADNEWMSGNTEVGTSLLDHLTDEVIMPLLRSVIGYDRDT